VKNSWQSWWNEIDKVILLWTIALCILGAGLFLNSVHPEMAGTTLGFISILAGPLVGAFTGVYLSFRKNNKHQEEINHEKKLLLLKILRHEVKKGIELLQEPSGNLIPIDAWNSIVYSGNIVLFEYQQATELGDIYFGIKNYNYEAKRTRDAAERSRSLAEPSWRQKNVEPNDHRNWRLIREHWEELSINLGNITEGIRNRLSDLEKEEWFNEGKDDLLEKVKE
jgi:hypothetical protein